MSFSSDAWRVSASLGALSLALLSAPAFAADELTATPEGDSAIQEVVVRGIRGGLDRALSTKRRADSVVDAISVEDIGQFPDVNIAESVQRISGVQINRTRGEGRTVNIRGLPSNFTQATFNGRVLPNALSNADTASSRTFDFTILPSEFVRTLSVYKSPTADLEDGGLAGSVDVVTAKPFDTAKRIATFSVQGERESNSGLWAPRVSGFFSQQSDDGRFGASLGVSYTRRRPETHTAGAFYTVTTEGAGIPAGGTGGDDLNANGVIEPTLQVRIPQQIYVYNYEEDNKRISLSSAFQYRVNDALTLSLEGFYSKLDVVAITNENLQIFGNANTVLSASTQTIGGIQTATRFRVADLDNRGGGRYEDRSGFIRSLVGGAKYEANGWVANFEVAYALSRQHRDNLNIATIANGQAEYSVAPGDDVGSIIYLNGYDQARLNPSSFRVASLNGEFNRDSSDEVKDAKFDVAKAFDWHGVSGIRFGAHYVDRAIYQDNERLTVTAAQLSNLVGGLPAGTLPGSFSAASFMKLRRAGSGSFLGSYDGAATFPKEWLASDTRAFVANYSDAQLISAGSLTNDASGITDVREKTLAGYVRADLDFGRLTGNVGVRVVRTEQTTVGVSPNLNGITVLPDAGGITRVPAAEPIAVDREYTDVLPSLNLKFDATDRLLFRLSASKTLTRPNLGETSPTTTANASSRAITQNNPVLDPFRSNNLDATAEWYFARDALLGTSLFYKDIESLIRRETTSQNYTVTYEYANGTTQQASVPFTVSRLVNGTGVTVKGAEVYYQQAFSFLPAPYDGLGTVINYTFIDNSDPTQLTGASRHNYNFTGYYEKGPFAARLSYSWRSGFLSAVGTGTALSTYARPFGTLDGSVTYKVRDNFSVVVEAVNILDTDERTFYEGGLPATYIDAGRRLFVGLRYAL
ncbi:TonB-dependent receptor [Asticcacaulis sp. W401b]|uniref:TonB-dependent receptor n=1 Tax=Asticcacaulis sp. W401b TaxID=3388666 RepID=UPI003970A348